MNYKTKAIAFLMTTLNSTLVVANEQEPTVSVATPQTDIFLFDLDLSKGKNSLSNGRNVTSWPSYDNQPSFTKNSRSFVFARESNGQTDVYEFFLEEDKTVQLTQSAATEYSPTPAPDNQTISFVSDRSASIWHAPRTDLNSPEPVQSNNNNREPIGYFAWNHETGDILYWSQYGFSVTLANQSTKDTHFVSGHALPSAPQIIPNTTNFSFVHRQTNGEDWIKEFSPKTKTIRPLAPLFGVNTNHTWTRDGSILMIQRGTLYQWNTNSEAGWLAIADIDADLITDPYRLAISPDNKKLAVVGFPVTP